MATPNSSSTKLDAIQYHEYFKVVWFSLDNKVPNELDNFVDYLEKCHSFETWNNCIIRSKNERKILLVLIDLFEHLSYFSNLSQIQSIYVSVKNLSNMEEEKLKYPKLVHIFTEERTLIERLRQDVLLTYRNDFSLNISCLNEMTVEHLDKNTFPLLWYQLVIYYLVHSPDVDINQLKKGMIKQCQLEYEDNAVQLGYINDFEKNCTRDNVLQWYTDDSLVFRLVNRAFRTRNIHMICKFRYFIILLHYKLTELSIQQQGTNCTTVYRGQIMKRNELEVLQSNVGHLISINTLMSTSRREDVARQFIAGAEVGVIFKINTASTSYNMLHPFGDISHFSSKPSEEEILFFAGAVLRLDSVEEENGSTWIIKLTLHNEKVEQMEQLMDGIGTQLTYITHWEHLFMKIDDLILFGKYYKILTGKSFSWKDYIVTDVLGIDIFHLITVLGDYERVVEYYKELLFDEKFIDESKSIILNILIGYNYSRLSKYNDALFHYGIALSSVEENNKLAGELYIHLGDACKATNNFQSALSYYEKALRVLTSHDVNDRDIARIYRKVSDIHLNQNNYEDAIICEEQADEIDQRHAQRSELNIDTSLKYFQNHLDTSSDHPENRRARLLYSIGLCLMKKSDYHQALDKFLEAKVLFETHLTLTNNSARTFIALYDSLSLVYLLLNDKFNTLIMLKRSIDIRISYPSETFKTPL